MALFWVMTTELRVFGSREGRLIRLSSSRYSSPSSTPLHFPKLFQCHAALGLQECNVWMKPGHRSEGGTSPAQLMDGSPTSSLPCQGLCKLSVPRLTSLYFYLFKFRPALITQLPWWRSVGYHCCTAQTPARSPACCPTGQRAISIPSATSASIK